MKDQFLPYNLSLTFKEIGFNEWCIAAFLDGELNISSPKNSFFSIAARGGEVLNENLTGDTIAAPLWQQAIDWLRTQHKIDIYPGPARWEVWKDGTRQVTISTGTNSYETLRKAAIVEALGLIPIDKIQ